MRARGESLLRARRAGSWVLVLIAAAGLIGLVGCTSTRHSAAVQTAAPSPVVRVSRPPYSPRPNIVFVLTDDLSTNLVPYMPHVVALARRGVTFSNYTVTDSYCCPSRASILTGRFPHNTRIFQNGPPSGGFATFQRRGEERATFATALQAAGYRTAMMGKYLNGYHPSAQIGGRADYVPPGWTTWAVAGNGYPEFDYNLNQNGRVVPYGHAPGAYLTTVLGARGRQFVADSVAARKPFFLELATFAPHSPFVPAPQDDRKFPGLHAPRPASFGRLPTAPSRWLREIPRLTRNDVATLDQDFRRRVQSVQAVDRVLGQVEDTLRRTGQLGNTMIVFSSDNGFHMGEHGLDEGKLTAFDTDVRVPLIVAGPGVPAGRTVSAVAQNTDLAPTFEALGRARRPSVTDGLSLVPLLHGATNLRWPTYATVEHHQKHYRGPDPDAQRSAAGDPPSYAAMRTAGFLYVRYADGSREYYDLRRDPLELHNLAGRLGAARVAALDRRLSLLGRCRGTRSCTAAAVPAPLTS